MKICLIRLLLTPYLISCTCVPSPQSTKYSCSLTFVCCTVGPRPSIAVAELLPRINTSNLSPLQRRHAGHVQVPPKISKPQLRRYWVRRVIRHQACIHKSSF